MQPALLAIHTANGEPSLRWKGVLRRTRRRPRRPTTREQSVVATAAEVSQEAASEHVGRLIIRDADGRDLPHEMGEVVLAPYIRQGATMLVPFRDGRFSLEGIPEGLVRIERATAFSEAGTIPSPSRRRGSTSNSANRSS